MKLCHDEVNIEKKKILLFEIELTYMIKKLVSVNKNTYLDQMYKRYESSRWH